MRYLIAILLGSLTACAANKVNVDINSCEDRGIIDGIMVAKCKKVTNID